MKHKSLLMAVLIVLGVVLGMAVSALAQQYTLSMQARDEGGNEKTQFARGEDFYLHIILNNADDVASCAFTLNFLDNVLAPPATNAEGTPVNSSDIVMFPSIQGSAPTHRENSSEAGKIYFAGAEIGADGGAKYSGGPITLFTVRLKVKENASAGNFNITLTQTELFNPAAGYGTDVNNNGAYDTGDTKGTVPVLVGALANTDANFGGDLSDDFPVLEGVQLLPLELSVSDITFAAASASITNTYSPLSGIQKLVYAGTGTYAGYGRYYQVMGTEVVDSVNCLKVNIKGHGNNTDPDADTEWYTVWLAQDASGVVWVLRHYDDLTKTDTVLGKAGAAVWAPATFAVGQRFGEIGDSYREVVETGVTVNLGTGLGPYTDCVKVKWVEGTDEDFYYLAPGVGIVKEEWNDGGFTNGWELQEIIQAGGGGYKMEAWGPGKSKLAVAFDNYGSGNGLYSNDGAQWTKLTDWVPDGMGAWGDSNLAALFTNYGSYSGLWNYDGGSWTKLTDWILDEGEAWGGNKFAAIFTTYGTSNGLWSYDGGQWTKLTDWIPDSLRGWGGTKLAVKFTNYGLNNGIWSYDGTNWTKLTDWIPDTMVAWGTNQLAAKFSSYGLYNGIYTFNGTSWTKLTDWVPSGDMVSWGGNQLATAFSAYDTGNGLYSWDGSVWTRFTDWVPDGLLAVGTTTLGAGFSNYGAGNGMWGYTGSWTKVTDWIPDNAVAWGTDGFTGVFTEYGTDSGLWHHTASWNKLTDWIPAQ